MRLAVLQFGIVIGELESTTDRGIVFRYSPDYASAPGSTPISLSLPIREREFSQAAALPFFRASFPTES